VLTGEDKLGVDALQVGETWPALGTVLPAAGALIGSEYGTVILLNRGKFAEAP
jgi:hypothetical protein